ncbi:PNPOx family protein [Flavivirga eckloniae]|uniref:Uncharacterized protein n=1 Tax=Flavivirga eckloniae TaxID=1803846 RepID=A0A2K9PYP2_9FLAO|nr:hypothetical protein [Flavivirga eckloniae]AUP81667.1 hypothetical protein C1H87_17070 [Flavivirga eckloniae]
MKHPSKYHHDNDINHMIKVIKAYPLAKFISVKDNQPLIPHLPLIYTTVLYDVKMFEITIDSWEGKFKHSLNKNTHNIEYASAELLQTNQ